MTDDGLLDKLTDLGRAYRADIAKIRQARIMLRIVMSLVVAAVFLGVAWLTK